MEDVKNSNVKEFELNGKKYKLINPGVRWLLKHTDQCTNKNGQVSNEKYMDGLIENCVSPKLTIDEFETTADLQEVASLIEDFHGKRTKKD